MRKTLPNIVLGTNCVTYCVIHKKQQKAGTFICGGGYKGVGLGACIGIEHNCRIILTLNSKSKTCSLADLGGIGLGSKIIGLCRECSRGC